MSLRLHEVVPGRPTAKSKQNTDVLTVAQRGFIAYVSGSNVILLDHELDLVDTLPFWHALPHRASTSADQELEGVSCNSASGLILAWCGVHVVIWKASTRNCKVGWSAHSTIVASAPITCLDFRDGTLVMGTKSSMELWQTNSKSGVVVWDRIWDRSEPAPISVCVSPFLSHVAWHRDKAKSVYIIPIDREGNVVGIPQELRHPREVQYIRWRNPKSDKVDAHLYTVTSNSVLRVYSTVLDDPSWFQLLFSLDKYAFSRSEPSLKGKEPASVTGVLWVIDAYVLRLGVAAEIVRVEESGERVPAESMKVMEALAAEECDVVAWFGSDGHLSLRSILNMDRRPPTLIKSLSLAKFPLASEFPPEPAWASDARLLYVPNSSTLRVVIGPTLVTPVLTSVRISLIDTLSSRSTGLIPQHRTTGKDEIIPVQLRHPIDHLVRTPNGRGLMAVGQSGEIGVWSMSKVGKVPSGEREPRVLHGKGQWMEQRPSSRIALFAKGRAIVRYVEDNDGGASITLSHLDEDKPSPTEPMILPDFALSKGDKVKMLLAVSDIDDGYSGRGWKTQRAVILAASQSGDTWVWRVTSPMFSTDSSSLYRLPVELVMPYLIVQVDPMGWHQSVIDWETNTPLQDMILTVSSEGVLEFWTPQLGHHFTFEKKSDQLADGPNGFGEVDLHGHAPWTRRSVVRTGRPNPLIARCSSRRKTVIVCEKQDASHEMTIWDSNVSEFSTGLELMQTFEKGEIIQDLDWTTTSDLQSVLAVGFQHKVILVCEQRMSYVESTPGWAPFLTIDFESYTTVPINDSLWLAGGSLAVGAGNQIYLFSHFLDRDAPALSPAESAKNNQLDSERPDDIFQLIAQQNGPLWDYHPTMLSQCLLWDKIHVVRTILLTLVRCLRKSDQMGQKQLAFDRLDPNEFYTAEGAKPTGKLSRKYHSLFDAAATDISEDGDDLSPNLITELVERLDREVTLPLSNSEKSMLATIAQATIEVELQRRSLDLCGLRYLISIRMYINQNRRTGASGSSTPASSSQNADGQTHPSRLSFRSIVWASHSESQEVLLPAATECCPSGKMVWSDAKRLGVFLWLRSSETVRSQLEVIARNRFMADEERDPTTCSLLFFALGKKKVVHGLWRQAPGHKEQQVMLKFLANDFEQERWKSAALKNAYALLAKQRYEYAAAFFMLGGCPKDAVNICLRQVDDWQLAVALARTVEGGTDGPLLRWILTETVVPLALAGGHRWLSTWAFWLLGRRDLAVRVIISPMRDVAEAWSPEKQLNVGDPENDDPSLLLLFQHLKSKSLQTAKGTSEIPGKLEFDFVLHNARVFFRMGCHPLALDLLRSWSFARPFFPPSRPKRKPNASIDSPKSRPATNGTNGPSPRRPSFMLASAHRRQSSMYMDMDVLAESEPPSRIPSPPTGLGGHPILQGSAIQDLAEEQPKKTGNLMKELKQDVQQGAAEFNMDSFF